MAKSREKVEGHDKDAYHKTWKQEWEENFARVANDIPGF